MRRWHLWRHAEETGFEGSDEEWEEQLEALCDHFGWRLVRSSGHGRSSGPRAKLSPWSSSLSLLMCNTCLRARIETA